MTREAVKISNATSYAQKLRVLYVTHYSGLYGANLSLYYMMLDARQRHNIQPAVFVPSNSGEFIELCSKQGIEVFHSRFYQWVYSEGIKNKFKAVVKCILNKIYFQQKIFAILKSQHFDLIHTNASPINLGSIIAQRFNIPHVWHIREYGFDDYFLRYVLPLSLVRAAYARASAVITISHSLYNYCVNKIKLCPAYNTVCITNGLIISNEYAKTYSRNGQVNFCIIGLIHPPKNQLIAVKACAKLKATTEKFMLHIIGSGETENIDELKHAVNSLGLNEHVKFWGFRNDVNEILRTMDVGLMLSKCEAFGRVTVEYMLNYMPVLGVDTRATPEVVLGGETGYICKLDDSDKLA